MRSQRTPAASNTAKRATAATPWRVGALLLVLLVASVVPADRRRDPPPSRGSSRSTILYADAAAVDNGSNNKKGNGNNKRKERRTLKKKKKKKKKKPNASSSVRKYALLTPSQIHASIQQWKKQYPAFLKVTSSQSEYGLPTAGTNRDCTFDKSRAGCSNYILTIQDYAVHPVDSESSNALPEVVWSGELHGDERLGPTAVMETAHLLLRAASCEAMPNLKYRNKPALWRKQVNSAKKCRNTLAKEGIDDVKRQWLARLVATRRLVVVPTTNALGYDRNTREEGGIDPNRDFPYDARNNQCMESIAARTLNELFRTHMFQLSITFHGGIEGIGYEWGNFGGGKKGSPDDVAQDQVARAYSRIAGSFNGVKQYIYGRMNVWLYPVYGGMEDWAYAGSWDTGMMTVCDPSKNGGYPKSQTQYQSGMLRALNMLVETTRWKTPASNTLGNNKNVLNPSGKLGNGHVSRNIRLALASLDLVEPYVQIQRANGQTLETDIVPKRNLSGRNCINPDRTFTVPSATTTIDIDWVVGGGVNVDATQIWYASWSDLPTGLFDCWKQPSIQNVQKYMNQGVITSSSAGNGDMVAGRYTGEIDLSGYSSGASIAVIASAQLDSSWTAVPDDVFPNRTPQTHIVNARTDPDWSESLGRKTIRGRLDWFSIPITVAKS